MKTCAGWCSHIWMDGFWENSAARAWKDPMSAVCPNSNSKKPFQTETRMRKKKPKIIMTRTEINN